ncbi:hypothetical protein [Microcoleus sp. AR_TQ3_B6]|uniref:hypothetical protein n=1 Tax=Microcoleus sp. AR_TQ3_B6 TaxID=3055284 RepID=UPI002FD58FA7
MAGGHPEVRFSAGCAGWGRVTRKGFLKTKNPGGRLPKPLFACERMALLVRLRVPSTFDRAGIHFFRSAILSALLPCHLDPQKSQS